ncbi:RNA-binding domain-containing protein [Thiothrix fructosivorans]|uniref:DNA binding domain-containing protein n=1 Tax=Thiothrix fructosivorans TaxID=111770 RepID=A0A8B0SEZ1_9GAMM|nr:RNA-binding domain-containing protein [Thiothrix fructosivorans]MBO0615134.1 putative DNA binding domain-containing protein [Thiothrix fructosivorans]QTX09926.1 putative DNA binding domain-containing protein [Thiothrix fructosivorans]
MNEDFLQFPENESLDFKRELNLSDKSQKGKLLRTIMAIANSSEYHGYIIVGVDDNRTIIGVNGNHEETIQQLCCDYTRPKVKITYSEREIDNKKIVILQIDSKEKPYEFSKSIADYKEYDVFIRHGSITRRASTKDIIEAYKSVQIFKETKRPSYPQKQSQLDSDISKNIEYITKLKSKEKEINEKIERKNREISSIEFSGVLFYEDEEDTDEKKIEVAVEREKKLKQAQAGLKELEEELSSNKLEHGRTLRENKALMDYKYMR